MLIACAPPHGSADVDLKAKLVGSWRFEYKDEFERAVQGTVRLSDDGKFFAVEMVNGEQGFRESRLSGPWYVTEGLFKLNTQVEDGKALGSLQQSFFTCKVAEFSAMKFDCSDELAKKTYTYTRVSSAS
ncbi:hypothetical protein GCM10028796_28910 [Ramlibacter monticola]|uniref:Uncharacterized protein n=1 Tax=Ramlibacter monticola TaxID=1926872 RepID=A0A936Z2R9_9BURK|nr:hypothetical protein [Ramlibacter monticola]MBL0393938.1 hypothetical protein [Ramlibacter monticola]